LAVQTDTDAAPAVEVQAPLFFAVSVPKLLVMSICTFGLYELYMQYRNWKFIQQRDNPSILPFWRAFFAYFFVYRLFSLVRESARANQVRGIPAGPLAAGWIILGLLWRLPDPYWLVTFASVFFVLPVQGAINRINAATCPGHDRNGRFSRWEIVIVVLGAVLTTLAVVGTFVSEPIE
jgi:hypothetical protein